ncbi:MAG: VOC family protein [Actinomycetota bacterium]|nr:VOC family protein [Actinomycetota bacterium]
MTECAITHVRYVALGVRDLSAQREFYRDEWGLQDRASDSDLQYFGAVESTDPFILRLRQADSDRLDLVSFAVPSASDVDAAAARMRSQGVRLLSEPHESSGPGGGYGFRFFDHEGRTLEVLAEVQAGPARTLEERDWHPGHLSHVVINSLDIEKAAAWYGTHLGLLPSDRLSDVMVFMRGNSSSHHMMAIAHGPYVNVNHVAYETRGIDEYLRASGRLMRSGLPCVWGPGRHGPGDNTFAYFNDRAGFVAEYTTALQSVDDWSAWTPRVHPITPEWSDQWGTACARNPEPFLGKPDLGVFEAPPV